MSFVDASGPYRDEIAHLFNAMGSRATLNAPFGARTTYAVGGPSAIAVSVRSEADLRTLVETVAEIKIPTVVLGRGSNMLVADSGFAGLVVQLVPDGDFAQVEVLEEDQRSVLVRIGGATFMPAAARSLGTQGFGGLEWAVGVPGSLGGFMRTNAGCHGSDMENLVVSARVIDLHQGTDNRWSTDDLKMTYRASAVLDHHIVAHAVLRLARANPASLREELGEYARWRHDRHPSGRNAGSVFKNPESHHAGALIDDAGLKGARIGGATVSTKHANFIITDRDGTAGDVRSLMDLVRSTVSNSAGVTLEAETTLVGFASQQGSSTNGRDPDPS